MTPRPARSLKGYLLLGVAAVTCPCHVPILLAVLAGTGLAGVLSAHAGPLLVGLTAVFLLSLLLGLRTVAGEPPARPNGREPPTPRRVGQGEKSS